MPFCPMKPYLIAEVTSANYNHSASHSKMTARRLVRAHSIAEAFPLDLQKPGGTKSISGHSCASLSFRLVGMNTCLLGG